MEARSDVEVWRETLDSLRQNDRIDASEISVDVTNGVVSLVGCVSTFSEKKLASDLAGRVRGVVSVNNALRVVPATDRTDESVAEDVRAALERDIRINLANRIGVTVNQGSVVLTGTVGSADQKLAAVEDTQSVAGVVDVVDNLQVIPNVIRHDAEIENDVRRKLIDDTIVDAGAIVVSVTNGIVTLSGSVPSLYQRQLAEDDTWAQPGVRGVINELRVSIPPFA